MTVPSPRDFRWIGFYELLRIVKIEGVATNIEPLRIGAGRSAALTEPTDFIVLKVYDKRKDIYVPVIPGSTWKGLLRSHVIAILRTLGFINVCDGLPKMSCSVKSEDLDARPNYDEKLKYIISGGSPICLGCLIFGAPGLSSHIEVRDSIALDGWKLGYRSMVAINRRTGAAHPGALFTVEYVEPGAEFPFTLIGYNLPNYAVGLLAEALYDIDRGYVKVGGLKTRGFGAIMFREVRVEVIEPGKRGAVKRYSPLDPYDKEADLEGKDGWEALKVFINIWREVSDRLREVDKRGWRWVA